MALPQVGSLISLPALDHPELVAPPVAAALALWAAAAPSDGQAAGQAVRDSVAVVEIDPAVADTAAMSAAYDLPMSIGANCVLVSGRREGEERIAACLVRADTRADVNNLVKRTLDVRKCSFLPMERAVAESGMEYGGITPVGLPAGWRVLIDPRVLEIDAVIIGSGLRRSKLVVAGPAFATLPGAEIVPGLGG
ncbi:MAG: YbaK/EbsC family protein [Nocardioides sp.]